MKSAVWGAALSLVLATTLVGATASAGQAVSATATLTGTVTLHGKPVAGAHLVLLDRDNSRVRITSGGVTNAHGRYELTTKPAALRVLVDGAGYAAPFIDTYAGGTTRFPDATVITARSGSTTHLDIPVRAGGIIEGDVASSDGTPHKGGWVDVTDGDNNSAVAPVDASGHYRVGGLAGGAVRVTLAESVGYASVSKVKVVVDATVTAKPVVVGEPATVTGRIKGVAKGTFVVLDSTGGSAGDGATVGAGGRVRFTVPGGTYRLLLGKNRSHTVRAEAGQTRSFGTVTASKASRTITGVVRGADGKPVKGASVYAKDSFGVGLTSSGVRTDSQGRYTLKGAGTGRYTVSAERGAVKGQQSFRTRGVTIAADARTVTRNLRFQPTFSSRVTVTSGGRPVAGIRVGSRITDSRGRVTITGLVKGANTVRFFDPYVGGYRERQVTLTLSGPRAIGISVHR